MGISDSKKPKEIIKIKVKLIKKEEKQKNGNKNNKIINIPNIKNDINDKITFNTVKNIDNNLDTENNEFYKEMNIKILNKNETDNDSEISFNDKTSNLNLIDEEKFREFHYNQISTNSPNALRDETNIGNKVNITNLIFSVIVPTSILTELTPLYLNKKEIISKIIFEYEKLTIYIYHLKIQDDYINININKNKKQEIIPYYYKGEECYYCYLNYKYFKNNFFYDLNWKIKGKNKKI